MLSRRQVLKASAVMTAGWLTNKLAPSVPVQAQESAQPSYLFGVGEITQDAQSALLNCDPGTTIFTTVLPEQPPAIAAARSRLFTPLISNGKAVEGDLCREIPYGSHAFLGQVKEILPTIKREQLSFIEGDLPTKSIIYDPTAVIDPNTMKTYANTPMPTQIQSLKLLQAWRMNEPEPAAQTSASNQFKPIGDSPVDYKAYVEAMRGYIMDEMIQKGREDELKFEFPVDTKVYKTPDEGIIMHQGGLNAASLNLLCPSIDVTRLRVDGFSIFTFEAKIEVWAFMDYLQQDAACIPRLEAHPWMPIASVWNALIPEHRLNVDREREEQTRVYKRNFVLQPNPLASNPIAQPEVAEGTMGILAYGSIILVIIVLVAGIFLGPEVWGVALIAA